MEINQERKEIKKLSKFLSEMHVTHYRQSSSIHITGHVSYVDLNNPPNIQIYQENGANLMLRNHGNELKFEVYSDVGSGNYTIQFNRFEIYYHNGELKIFLEES